GRVQIPLRVRAKPDAVALELLQGAKCGHRSLPREPVEGPEEHQVKTPAMGVLEQPSKRSPIGRAPTLLVDVLANELEVGIAPALLSQGPELVEGVLTIAGRDAGVDGGAVGGGHGWQKG